MRMEYVLLVLMVIPPVALAINRRGSSRRIAHIDLGVVFSWIVFLYAWLPLMGLTLAQHEYGALQDSRVVNDAPTSSEIVIVGICYLVFLAGFGYFYRWRRNTIQSSTVLVMSNGYQVFFAVIIASLMISLSFLFQDLLGLDGGSSYIDSYVELRHLPRAVQQIMNGLAQSGFAASLAAMVFIISWRPHFHRYVALAILVFLLVVTFSGGSRTFGFLLAFAYVICVSIYVKRIKIHHLFLLAIVGLFLFTFSGVFRAGDDINTIILAPLQGGEFVSLFINSIDLHRESVDGWGIVVPWQIQWVDILRFVPQQILPFDKTDPAVWYASNYYPDFYAMGGGLAFGAIAESIIGFGITESFVRGAFLGMAYAFVANRCITNHLTPMKVFIYIWFIVMSYQGIRDTTFSVFPRFVFQVLPVIVLLSMGYRVICSVTRRSPEGMQAGAESR